MSDKRKNFRMTFAAAVVLLAAVAVLLIQVSGGLRGARLDLTTDRIHSMSPGAQRTLASLQAPVQVKLYITDADSMPSELRNLERDVTAALDEFSSASDGMIQFSVHYPEVDQQMKASLTQRGVQPFRVSYIDQDEIRVKPIWSALTIAYKDRPEEIIPRILPQVLSNFEYELISRVYRMTRDKQMKVALVARPYMDPQVAMQYLQRGMQPPAPQDNYRQVVQLLEQENYLVERIELTRESPIPADADVLVVLNPVQFEPRQAYEINRALSNGMPVLTAVQLHQYSYQPDQRGDFTVGAQSVTSGLEDLLKGLGLTVDTRHLFDTSTEMLSIPRTQNVGGLRFQTNEPVALPMQVKVNPEQVDNDVAFMQRLGPLFYLWGTALGVDDTVLGQHGLQRRDLFTASPAAWRADFQDGLLMPEVLRPLDTDREPGLPLGVLLTGRFPDTFAGAAPPAWQTPPDSTAAPDPGPAPLLLEDSHLIVLGCAKMFDDMVLQADHNPLLLLNAVDELTGRGDLVSLRAKALLQQRTLRTVSANEKRIFRLFTMALVPALVAAFGLMRAARRRKEAAR